MSNRVSEGPPESADGQPAAYDEDYFDATYGTEGLRPLGLHWWAVHWYAAMAARCLRRDGGRRVLEIGCGQGFLLARLERRFETWGIDISPYAIRATRRFAPASRTFVADLEGMLPAELRAQAFDMVVAKYVFEHLRDPLRALRKVATLLRPGGLLLFAVPYTASLGARRKGAAWFASTASDPTHCSLLSRAEWLELAGAAGLVVERESADGWWDVPYLRGLPGWAQLPLFGGPTVLACLSGRPLLPAGWGENILVFARKPRS